MNYAGECVPGQPRLAEIVVDRENSMRVDVLTVTGVETAVHPLTPVSPGIAQ